VSEVDFLVARVVEQLRYPANGLRIVFDQGDRVCQALYADLEQPFTFVTASGEVHHADPSDPASLGPVLALAGETVERVSTADAILTLVFLDGSSLRCEPHPHYEAWQVCGGTPQFLVVCSQLGEGLAVFDVNTPEMSLSSREALPPNVREVVDLPFRDSESRAEN
jgi:hypothetical protein